MFSINENIVSVRNRIKQASEKAGKNPDEIKLIAVSKTFPADYIIEAINCGIKDIGENKVQEASGKYPAIGKDVCWHLVGHLQTNKVKKALEIFDYIHSVDSFHLAEEINKRAGILNKIVKILVEVNTTSEASKFGVGKCECIDFVKKISSFENFMIMGLMTIGTFSENPEDSRTYFAKLRELKEKLEDCNLGKSKMKYLSMGMTNDFEVAIEEGANMVRIGTAVFGKREIK